ncbi:hypothetical protein AALG83_06135 [Christensenellaceae bacterium 44-20]
MTTDINVNIEEYRQLIVVIQQTQTSIANLQAQQKDCDKALQNSKGMKEMETQSKKMQGAFELVGAASKTIESMTGGVVSEFAGMVTKSYELASGIASAAQSAGLLQSSMQASLIGLGLTAVFAVITAITEAEERARQKAEELRQELSEINNNNIGASELISEYEALSNKTIKTVEDTERMRDIRADLVEQYGYSAEAVDEEGRLLAGNLDIMKEQLAVERERLLLSMQAGEGDTKREYNENINKKKRLTRENSDLDERLQKVPEGAREEGAWQGNSLNLQNFRKNQIEIWEETRVENEKELKELERTSRLNIQTIFTQIILTAQVEGREVPEKVQGIVRDAIETAFEDGEDYDTAKSRGEEALKEYFNFDGKAILNEATPGINQLKRDMLATIFSESGGEVSEEDADFVNQLFDSLSQKERDSIEDFLELRDKVQSGDASIKEQADFERLKAEVFEISDKVINQANQHLEKNPKLAQYATSAMGEFKNKMVSTHSELDKTAELEEKAKEAALDFARGGEEAINRLSEIKGQMRSLGQQRAAIEVLKKGEKNSKEYAEAMNYLSKSLNMNPDEILENLSLIDENAKVSEEDFASFLNCVASSAGITFQINDDGSLKAIGDDADDTIKKIIDVFNWVLSTDGASIGFEVQDGKIAISNKIPDLIDTSTKKSSGKKSGGGGGSAKNTALEREMSLMEHKKAMDQLTTQEEIDNLERILNKYAKTNEEKEDIIEKLYSLRKQKAKEDLEYQKAMDQLTLREEIEAIDAQIATYKAGTQARRDLEKERYSLAKELQRQEYDLKVYYGQLTLKQQEQQLSLMLADYKKGTQARIDLEQELYDIQQQIRENGITRIDSVADGVIQALQNRYAEQQRIETERLEESKENWKKWGDEQVDAIQKQIDALDELTKQEDKEEQERQKRRKVASLEQQLLYETDLYNQTKLQEQLANARKELDDWLRQQEREELKASLQEQINQVQQKVEAEQEKIDKQIEANDKYYEELTKEQNLQAEAQKLLMKNNQVEILNLLKNFAPDYNLTGQSLGEQLVDGFMGKVADIEAWFGGLTAKFSQYQNQIASIATQAADEFYRTHGVATGMQNSAAATGSIAASAPQITMIFNQPVESPTEIRREMERLAEQLANL